jgi:hypothetical protein
VIKRFVSQMLVILIVESKILKMRFFVLVLLLLGFSWKLSAQNVQLHYDFGADRQMPTSTFEMFRPDSVGSTFFFVDFDYGGKVADVNGVSLAYMEISRELKFWENPFAIHVEYNGGMLRTANFATDINNAALFGGSYTWNNSDFTRIFSFQVLYKYIERIHDASFQITGVWEMHFFNRKISFTGFADFWREKTSVFDDDNVMSTERFIFISEPQLWYNFNKNISLGGEVELSNNFGAHKGFMVNPTVAVKYAF